ncbi:MAG TPA: TIGR03435 family protein [Bryobacteraceae bacterium]|nr:TIGR03435 family protein [Bryobacteraceae bacterium]
MVRGFVVGVVGVGMVFAQPKPAFVLADVHVSPRVMSPSMEGGFVRGDRYQIRMATMVDLIHIAWGVGSNNVAGGPAWLDYDRFDVIAKVPPKTTQADASAMLQALLIERFGLAVHPDTKPLSGYALTFVRRSGQMKEAADPEGSNGCRPSEQQEKTAEGIGFVAYNCRNIEMSGFAQMLRQMAPGYIQGMPIVDQTGLKGGWYFSMKWVGRAQVAAAGGEEMSLFGAIGKLGLKLERKDVPQPVVVVDKVNEKPTPNAAGVKESLPPIRESFEVAELRPSAPGSAEGGFSIKPGGRLDAQGITLKDLISFAWQTDYDDEVVGPKSMETNRFDIVAKAPGVVSGERNGFDVDSLSHMVKTLLEDRFRLKVHTEDRPVTIYALIAVKPKMKTADASNRTSCKNTASNTANLASSVSRTFICQNMTMAQLAEKLPQIGGGYIDHAVVDMTELDGAYDFPLNFSPMRAFRAGSDGTDPNGAISLFEAVEKLGVKLEQRKHTMPVLVIDHVEEQATDN